MYSVIPKLYRCDAKQLHLDNQVIYLKDLCFVSSFAEEIRLYLVTVMNEDDSIVAFEKLFETFLKAKNIEVMFKTMESITSTTVNELLKNPKFHELDVFSLIDIPGAFDIDLFYKHIKKNKHTEIIIRFDYSVSESFTNRLRTIIDEILEAEIHDYRIPYIAFPDIDEKKNIQLICKSRPEVAWQFL
uniref:Uncharacterized protein n=1 Tax=Panagrolaimus davidi TaxID=227884 RepID=A0A914P514_9BILA